MGGDVPPPGAERSVTEVASGSVTERPAESVTQVAAESVTEVAVTDPSVTEPPAAPRILVLEHDPSDPPLLLGDWLAEAGAAIEVRRLHAGDEVPGSAAELRAAGFDALISMGGEMGATDDEAAPWLPATRALLADAVAARLPFLGVCLGAQLLAVATGGRVRRGAEGPEIGAYLTAKRDAAEADPLFAGLPLTPDVMHHHYDAITDLPPGAVLLLSSMGPYPNQAFRVGPTAWGIQGHIETTAGVLRGWGANDPDAGDPTTGRRGAMLDAAEEVMGQVWRAFAHRFAELAATGVPLTAAGGTGTRLPLISGDL
jgi:GMP synthase-like glutamine amidotransferase